MLPGSGRTSLLGSCLSTYNLRYIGLLGLSVFFLLGLEQVHVVVVCPRWTCAQRPSNKVNTFLLPLFRNIQEVEKKTKKKSQTFCKSLGGTGLFKKLGQNSGKFATNVLSFFTFLFCTRSLHTYLPHGPYLFFLLFISLAGIPLTSFSKDEYCSPGPFNP